MSNISHLEQKHPNLNLSPEEKRLFGQVFAAADTENIGVVTGDVALKFFPERTKLPSETLGEIWQIADTEDKGFLTPAGFGIILRLIGYAQAGRPVSAELALKPGGPLPRFDGINAPPPATSAPPPGPLQPQASGGPIRVPPLAPEQANRYAALFEESGAQGGLLPGVTAKQIFDRANLPNDVLARIWNLADTESRGMLSTTEFIIAMHLLASYRSGSLRALPQSLPPGLYEAASRRGVPPRQNSRPTSEVPPASAVPRQFSGAGPQRTSSPLARPPYGSTAPTSPQSAFGPPTPAASDWAISPQEKAQFDTIFPRVDSQNRGYITGEQAVVFFSNSKLPEDDLAQIWDLADINSEGQLNRDEFAVAMHLIRLQLAKKDGPSELPQTLPANLIPPSMRRQTIPPPQSTAPAFDNAANLSKPKSAVEDLFGLDALSAPVAISTATPVLSPQVPQSTGGTTIPTPISPQFSGTPQPPRQTQPFPQSSQSSSVFKPFYPSSSFGQSIVTPQGTGTSTASAATPANRSQQSQPRGAFAESDLLGDNDPEISKRLNQETTDLANLSNQIGTLSTQMQQVKSKRASTEQDLSQMNTQKKDFEARLVLLRAAYEQEARDLKALEDRFAISRAETQKIQQDLSAVQVTHQELHTQYQQVATALTADQQENANLKERMRLVNNEINELKPRLEKIRSDTRKQKGLVAINKKQLSTLEAEQEKIKADVEAANQEHSQATKELEESQRSIENFQKEPAPVPVTSPAASTTSQSLNPFFRRAATSSSDKGFASQTASPQTVTSPNHNAFDSFFGPSFGSSSATSSAPPPATTFGSAPTEQSHDISSPPTPVEPPLTNEFPMVSEPTQIAETVPPPPSASRQITSSNLPLRDSLERTESVSSSVKVSTPASRFGDETGIQTPQPKSSHPLSHPDFSDPMEEQSSTQQIDPPSESASRPTPVRSSSSIYDDSNNQSTHTLDANRHGPSGGPQDISGPSSGPSHMPGAFPGDTTPPMHTPQSTFDQVESPLKPGETDNFFSPTEQSRGPAKQDEFDSAFSDFETPSKPANQTDKSFEDVFNPVAASNKKSEFPPIQEFGGDDESSDDEHRFEDDFTGHNSHQKLPVNGHKEEPQPPKLESVPSSSQLPTADAQKSPPTYDQVTSTNDHHDPNQFPAEYGGLLPSREIVSSPPPGSQPSESAVALPSNGEITSPFSSIPSAKERALSGSSLPPSQMPMAPGATAAPFAYTQPPPQMTHSPFQPPKSPFQSTTQTSTQPQQPNPTPKDSFDDFDDDFKDLSEAKEADDLPDVDFGSSIHREGPDEFNPVFDSPAPSRTTNSTILPNTNPSSSFHDFGSTFSDLSASTTSRAAPSQAPPPASSHDWDAIFAGLDDSAPNGEPATAAASSAVGKTVAKGEDFPSVNQPVKPDLNRTFSAGTADDEPILKELVAMGYPRSESLSALEKFDYDIVKVRHEDSPI
ncbi:MAG: hypothetical protein MMC33_003849 [Icmadophila ericetorum]|nr:hypothetical protein [Icmadophila ericetorum]